MVQVELSRHDRDEGAMTDRVIHTCHSIARHDEKIKTHYNDVDNNDDSGGGGGSQHGVGAERLEDAEASLAGDNGGQDLGNPGKAKETVQVVVGYVLCDRAISVNKTETL